MSRRRGTQRSKKAGGELSSDEELIRQSPRLSGRKQQASKTASQSTYMADVCRLTDEELLDELKSYGENPGPIVDSTRGLYQKKLARLIAEKTKVSDQSRSREVVDYGTDHMGEWSSHSSEGETDPEEGEKEEEEEEEAGVVEDPVSVRQRSSSSKSQQVVYRTYSTPTRVVESSYLLRKPKSSPSKSIKTPAAGGGQQSSQKVSKSSKRPPPPQSRGAPPPQSSSKSLKPPPPQSSHIWSSLLSLSLLLVMFTATFMVYDHYTNPESSFFTQTLAYLRELDIIKNSFKNDKK